MTQAEDISHFGSESKKIFQKSVSGGALVAAFEAFRSTSDREREKSLLGERNSLFCRLGKNRLQMVVLLPDLKSKTREMEVDFQKWLLFSLFRACYWEISPRLVRSRLRTPPNSLQ